MEKMKDRESWHVAVHRVTKIGHDCATEQQQHLDLPICEIYFSFILTIKYNEQNKPSMSKVLC